MKVIESWDIDANFWEVNPQFKMPKVFRRLYDEDTTKGKTHSSKLMWAIAFYTDFDSKYRRLIPEERRTLIAEDILKNPDYDWSLLEDQIKAWEMFKSNAVKQMVEWDRLMGEKTVFMQSLKYDLQNAEWIEERLNANTKLYKAYDAIMEQLSKEGDAGVMWGGSQESLTEKGII